MLKKLLLSFVIIMLMLSLSGCELALFDPKGPIGEQAKDLILISTGLLLIVIIPVLFMSIYFPYKFRKGNTKAEYKPHWEHSTKIEVIVWLVPCLIVAALAYVTYVTSHSLDPRKPLGKDEDTLTIQVVALDWKWLFIYPEQQIATVNEIAIPVNKPIEFLITSDTVMNSFFIPRLGSQIYAMAGMENRLNLMASEEGVFRGLSANYSGFGFSGMKFKTHSVSDEAFEQWVDKVKTSPKVLDNTTYQALTVKSKDNEVEHFADVDPLHFKKTIEKYTGVQNGQ
ncbi:ubiquinol oxidase subunit II [Pseudoalteromonas aurantia]|uniref:Ubiquinol oxidase subunit 2 n=1 Tax=Pseudoalteromonas aurantia 208 TaxID=1314867 RepID=A0ABR9ECT2_9GAMM|nr:ubiquinol oxidase subunit II [Pseudoalteromonas aurantia]MBE0368805.1 cytochrome o ubiquinol oxidase subunit II [Pseudoalteromonas aurantia 208]